MEKSLKIMSVILIVLFGIILLLLMNIILISAYTNTETEQPVSAGAIRAIQKTSYSPSDFIKESDMRVYDDKIVILIEGASLSRYKSTGSMIPTFDSEANGIRIKPENENQIKIGDIVTYVKNNRFIVHRVVEKGEDNLGTYFITKGDNNQFEDGKVRFEDIEYVTIAILY